MITFRQLHISICDQIAGHTVDLSLRRPVVCAWMTTEKKLPVINYRLQLIFCCVCACSTWGVGVGGRWMYVWRVRGWGGVDPDCGRLWSPMLPHLVSRTETTGPGRCGSSSLADREFEAPLLRYSIVFFLYLMEMTVATPTGLGRTGCYSLRHHTPSAPVSTGDDLFTSPVCVR